MLVSFTLCLFAQVFSSVCATEVLCVCQYLCVCVNVCVWVCVSVCVRVCVCAKFVLVEIRLVCVFVTVRF